MRWLLAVAALLPAAAFSADPVAGKYWYEQNCARCHGSPPQERQAGTPNITGFGADRIQNALRNVSAMAKVNLSATQVQDVAAYLVDPPRYTRFPGVDYNDQWWNPQEPGWGLSLYQRPNASTTGTLLIYDQDGVPMWLLLAGLEWRSPQRLEGVLARTTAAGFPAQGFDPRSFSGRAVGTLRIQFLDTQRAQLEFEIDGQRYSRTIERLGFGD